MDPITKPLSLRWSGHTDVGRVRNNNEDCFLALALDAQEVRYLGKMGALQDPFLNFVFAVSDGMGGAMAGEFASRIAVEKITKMLPAYLSHLCQIESSSDRDAACYQVLTQLFQKIHHALLFLGASYEECYGMGTTLSLCWVRPHQLYFGHVGDSRIYKLPKEGGIKQLSEDDTHVGWLLRNGKITERESKNHPGRNLLQKVLGANHEWLTPQVSSVSYVPGDRFLICSDGITDGLLDIQLLTILATPSQKSSAQQLVEEAVAQSGRDNATAVVIEIV